jgi:hemoglobin-like flavoprotein
MDQQRIERLESSFNLVAPRAQELVDRFYALLFSRYPQVRPMFPNQMGDQKKKLIASLVLVVQNIRTPNKLLDPLTEMGKRHVEYGAVPEHYPLVRDTMLEVLGEIAGKAWTDQLNEDWTVALDLVSSIMIEGARTATQAATQTA